MIEDRQPQSERASVMLTKDEARDLQLVAALDNRTVSETLREYTIAQIIERAERIRTSAAAA